MEFMHSVQFVIVSIAIWPTYILKFCTKCIVHTLGFLALGNKYNDLKLLSGYSCRLEQNIFVCGLYRVCC